MKEPDLSSLDPSRNSRDPILGALAFRRGVELLLQEGFDGLDYLSADEVLQLQEEVLIFLWTFFKEEAPLLPKENPTIVSGDTNTNPDFGTDLEAPQGRPISLRGWAMKPRRKRDKQLATFFRELLLVIQGVREAKKNSPQTRIAFQEKLEKRLGQRLKNIEHSVSSSDYCPGGPGIRVNPKDAIGPIYWLSVEEALKKGWRPRYQVSKGDKTTKVALIHRQPTPYRFRGKKRNSSKARNKNRPKGRRR